MRKPAHLQILYTEFDACTTRQHFLSLNESFLCLAFSSFFEVSALKSLGNAGDEQVRVASVLLLQVSEVCWYTKTGEVSS